MCLQMGWHNLSKRANVEESQTWALGEGDTAFHLKSICCKSSRQESKAKAIVWPGLKEHSALSKCSFALFFLLLLIVFMFLTSPSALRFRCDSQILSKYTHSLK